MGVSQDEMLSRDKRWRISTINRCSYPIVASWISYLFVTAVCVCYSDYKMSPSYPGLLVVPSVISDQGKIINIEISSTQSCNLLSKQELLEISKFRQKGRIPALSWRSPDMNKNACICRSSQPRAGLLGKKSIPRFRWLSTFPIHNCAIHFGCF